MRLIVSFFVLVMHFISFGLFPENRSGFESWLYSNDGSPHYNRLTTMTHCTTHESSYMAIVIEKQVVISRNHEWDIET